jgi:hypothetical protein
VVTVVWPESASPNVTSQIENLNWPTLTNIAGRSTNWTTVVIDPSTNLSRYYRLVTPQQQPSER